MSVSRRGARAGGLTHESNHQKDHQKEEPMLSTQVAVVLAYVRARVGASPRLDEGSVVEKVILTAVFALLAISIGAIIVAKVTAKANSINLG